MVVVVVVVGVMVVVYVLGITKTGVLGRAGLSDWYNICTYAAGIKTISDLRPPSRWTLFGLLVLVSMCLCLFSRCLLEDAGKRDYCDLNGCVADICVVCAFAVGNMDVKSVDTLNYLLFHLRLRSPTFHPPLRLKSLFLVVAGCWV